MERIACILPAGVPVQVEAWSVAVTAVRVLARASSAQPVVHCPVCGEPSPRLHSQYYPDCLR